MQTVGLNDLKSPFQPRQFCDSVNLLLQSPRFSATTAFCQAGSDPSPKNQIWMRVFAHSRQLTTHLLRPVASRRPQFMASPPAAASSAFGTRPWALALPSPLCTAATQPEVTQPSHVSCDTATSKLVACEKDQVH